MSQRRGHADYPHVGTKGLLTTRRIRYPTPPPSGAFHPGLTRELHPHPPATSRMPPPRGFPDPPHRKSPRHKGAILESGSFCPLRPGVFGPPGPHNLPRIRPPASRAGTSEDPAARFDLACKAGGESDCQVGTAGACYPKLAQHTNRRGPRELPTARLLSTRIGGDRGSYPPRACSAHE